MAKINQLYMKIDKNGNQSSLFVSLVCLDLS